MDLPLQESLIFLWAVRTIKFVLFWIYLWQLKEYHIGRFKDHFTTHKGRILVINYLFAVKIALFAGIFWYFPLVYVLLLVYAAESALFLHQISNKAVKKPVLTFKTALLTLIGIICTLAFAWAVYFWQWPVTSLLGFDILTPVIVTIIVLALQPFFVLVRLQKLGRARKKLLQFPNLKVIAITGSYGKTATKEFLATLLASKYKVLVTPKHRNSEMGIAETILKDLEPSHEVFVVEMGAYNKGGITLLCDMVRPSIGIVTGVNQQHLSTFGSLDNLLSAEGGRELVKALPQDGLITVNGDNTYCLQLYKNIYAWRKGSLRKKAYTLKKEKIDSDVWTEDIVVSENSISFLARTKDKEIIPVSVNVLGRQQVQNMLGAILVARELGVTSLQIQQAVANIVPDQAGMTKAFGIHGITIIDSSYSSNPDGVLADLDFLNVFKQKKVVIMPCLIELGEASGNIHWRVGKKIAEVCSLAIITTKDRFEDIKKGAMENGMEESRIILCDNPEEIMEYVTTQCQKGDAVLLEGRVPGRIIQLLKP